MTEAEKALARKEAQERIDKTAQSCFGSMMGSEFWESTTVVGLAVEAYDAAEALELERTKRIAAQKGEDQC